MTVTYRSENEITKPALFKDARNVY